MKVQVARWGNSLAVRLPKAVALSLHAEAGAELELELHGDRVELRPVAKRYRLDELLAEMTPENQPEIVEIEPLGEEML